MSSNMSTHEQLHFATYLQLAINYDLQFSASLELAINYR